MPPDQDTAPTLAISVPRCVIYGRVSTAGQVEGTSLAGQLAACRAAAARHGWEVVAEHVDAGESGANADRPALAEVMDSVESGGVDVLVVYRLDRLARSTLHLLTLVQRLEAADVRLVSTSESIDTRTPTGRMTMTVLGSVAELERETIRTRTREGVARRVAQGGWVSSTPPFGYRAVPDTRAGMRGVVLQIDPAQAVTIREMHHLLVVERTPLTQAVAALNDAGHRTATGRPWTRATLSTWARGAQPRTSAAGSWHWGTTGVAIPAILTPDQVREWQAWQADTSVAQTSHGQYLLSGHLRTPCGRRYHGRTATGQAPTYSCRHHLSTRAGTPEHCSCTNISVTAADAAVWGEVARILMDPTALAALAAEVAGVGAGSGDTAGARAAEASRAAAEIQERVAAEYQGARDAGFDAATARLMVRGGAGGAAGGAGGDGTSRPGARRRAAPARRRRFAIAHTQPGAGADSGVGPNRASGCAGGAVRPRPGQRVRVLPRVRWQRLPCLPAGGGARIPARVRALPTTASDPRDRGCHHGTRSADCGRGYRAHRLSSVRGDTPSFYALSSRLRAPRSA